MDADMLMHLKTLHEKNAGKDHSHYKGMWDRHVVVSCIDCGAVRCDECHVWFEVDLPEEIHTCWTCASIGRERFFFCTSECQTTYMARTGHLECAHISPTEIRRAALDPVRWKPPLGTAPSPPEEMGLKEALRAMAYHYEMLCQARAECKQWRDDYFALQEKNQCDARAECKQWRHDYRALQKKNQHLLNENEDLKNLLECVRKSEQELFHRVHEKTFEEAFEEEKACEMAFEEEVLRTAAGDLECAPPSVE
jgi:hypothetical protein